MLVRQQTASHNPLLSSSSDNASSTPPRRLLSSSPSSPSRPPPNNPRKLLNQLFPSPRINRNTHMLLELTRCTAGVNLSPHRFLVWCADVCARMCEEWSILKVRECLSVLRCIRPRPRGADIVTYWPLNASCFPFVAPQHSRQATSAGLRMLLAGPWARWWLLQRIFFFFEKSLCFIFFGCFVDAQPQRTIALRREETWMN